MKKAMRTHLIAERKRRRWSQQEVADRLGTTRHNVSRWEAGLTTPGPYFRVRLCELFGKQAQELGLFFQDRPPSAHAGPEKEASIQTVLYSHLPQSPGLWSVSHPRNPFFTGRQELLQALHEKLSQEHRMALTQSWAISGLGGIGKTQIALEYAYQYRKDYAAIFWISAATRETFVAGLVNVAEFLQLPEKDERNHQRVIQAVKQWLAAHQQWLVILDNADEITVVRDVFPAECSGHLLLTTRAQALGPLAQRIDVTEMGMAEGTLLLLRRTKLLAPDMFLDQASQEQLAGAEAIVIEMDFLPLALDQAGAYIDEVGCSLSMYLELYRTHRRELLQRRGCLPIGHPEPVATTWSLNFRQIEQVNPAAAELLRLFAFLEPDTIPEELLSDGRDVLGPVLHHVASDSFILNEAIEELRKFSLIQRDPEARLLRLHRLVQAVLRDTLSREDQRQWAERAVRVVSAVFPATVEVATWSRCRRFLSQAQMCSVWITDYTFVLPEAASLLQRTATYLKDSALYEQAKPLYQQALQIWERILGPDHAEVVFPLHHLAILYAIQGNYEQAEPLFQRTLSIRERALGPDHPEVTFPLHNLANIYKDQGKHDQAEALYQRVLRIREHVLGIEHHQVAYPLHGLAALFIRQGRFGEAEPLLLRAFHIREQALGKNHPAVASDLNGLAELYRKLGRGGQAEPLYQRALQIFEQTVGTEHPEMAHPLDGLAHVYVEQGKDEEAEALYQCALRIWEKALGPEHHERAYSLTGLADLYRKQRKDEQAEQLYQQALRTWEQALGSRHPEIASPLNGLANLYTMQGKHAEAELLFQRALSIREDALGEQHIDTAETLHDFAAYQEIQKKHQEAALCYQRALTIRKQILGGNHPKTTDTYERLRAVLMVLKEQTV